MIEWCIRTEPERFAAVLEARARILIEAWTGSEWVARWLKALGHKVIVADPNFAPMYTTRTRKVKTDRRDARALAELSPFGIYRPVHRLYVPGPRGDGYNPANLMPVEQAEAYHAEQGPDLRGFGRRSVDRDHDEGSAVPVTR